MRLFLDTLAFVKRYVDEPGSNRVLELMALAETLGLCVLVLPEAISTLRRLVREGRLSTNDYAAMKDAMLCDVGGADICDLTPAALEHSIVCLERQTLRALDAIHIGCAQVYQPDLFVSADRRQCEAARNEGLPVECLLE